MRTQRPIAGRLLSASLLACIALAGCTRWLPENLKPETAPPQAVVQPLLQEPNELIALNERVVKLRREGRFGEAIPLALRAVALYEEAAGPESPYTATALHTLAELYRTVGQYAKAEPLYQRTLAIQEKALGAFNPDIAVTLNNLALLYKARGDAVQAEGLHQRALGIFSDALGPEHLYVARTLENLALLYRDTGDNIKAESLLRRALGIYERTQGLNHPDVATALGDLASVVDAMKDHTRAEPLLRRALDIDEQAFGPNHPRVAADLNDLAHVLKALKSYRRAEPLYRRALEIREKAFGPNDPLVATSLNNLAVLYGATGELAKAEPLYQRALEIREKVLGPSHPDVGATLTDLATLYRNRGEYAKARPLYARALEIREKALGPTHPDVGATLHNLAVLYDVLGEYAQAEPLYRRALEIREKALGASHPDVAATLSDLAALYDTRGEYKKAEPLYTRVLSIREKTLGRDHPDVAAALTNLAEMYRDLGNYTRAEPLLQRALGIHEQASGGTHPAVATDLANLAELYRDMGDQEKAGSLLRQALVVSEQAVDPGSPQMAVALNNLGQWHIAMGEYGKAEPLLQLALEIDERALGPDHPDLASVLNGLALVYRRMGSPAKAEPLYARALGIREKALSPDHSAVAQSLNNLADLDAAQHRYRLAADVFRKALAIQDLQIRNVFPFTTEEHQAVFSHYLIGDYLRFLSLIHQHLQDDRQAVREGLEVVLRRKGAVVDARSRVLEALSGRLAEPVREEWGRLTNLRKERAQLLLHKAKNMRADIYLARLASLGLQIEETEQRVAAASGWIARERRQRTATVDGIAGSLPKDAALVEFVKIRDFDFAKDTWQTSWRYLAYVLDAEGNATLVDLGEAGKLESLVRAALKEIRAPTGARGKRAARSAHGRGKRQPSVPAPGDLYARIWVPLEKALGHAEKVLLSPDGLLNLLPFAAVRDGAGRFLVERYQIAYLTSGRDLIGPETALERPGSELLIVANPAFDGQAGRSGGKMGALRSRDFFGFFSALPRTARDGLEVPPLVDGQGGLRQVLLGPRATEGVVKAAHSPRVVHLATHSFFLKDEALLPDPAKPGGALMRNVPARLRVPARPSENPLLRAGLALAGASYAADITENDDGLLTALDISGMDLDGTELVVLSACDTGEGTSPVGDAVYALRRAFVLAGARTLLMSLWPADDERTARQVKAFYRKWATLPPAQALREIQLETIQQLRAESGGLAPRRSWAPFIVQGAQALGR